MRVILVDDERLALRLLKKMLESDIGGVEVIGMYTDPLQVIEHAIQLQPDVVFLDIHMPGISGLKLGELLQESVPSTKIVFVTGFDQYAIEAFTLNAMDYIMKPIQLERLKKTLERFGNHPEMKADNDCMTDRPFIRRFNQMQYQLHDEISQDLKWRTGKAQELFAYLLHHHDRVIDKETLIELLWSEYDTPRAIQYLYTTIYHIRQTLKSSGLDTLLITSRGLENAYKLTIGNARIDTEEWEAKILELLPLSLQTVDDYEQALEMYKGDYLGDYPYLWAEPERERLRWLWLRYAKLISAFYLEHNIPQHFIKLHIRVQQWFPYDEESYFSLMKLYSTMGDVLGIKEQYALLTSRLEQDLDVTVSDHIRTWYDQFIT